ncbi:MAG TPA: plastocyanin/azurin family copper-binding protein [Rubricoccaceae bacterium]|nr:plastocyanin/azurin family copper-binding protein [Rubricoccaceae bacterium]
MSTRRLPLFALVFAVLGLAACGGGDEPAETPEPTPAPPQTAEPTPAAPTAEPVPAYDGPAFEITMNPVGEQMEYEQKEFTVHPGQTVRITFQNTATNPAMHHNVVVLQADANVNAIGQAAMGAAANDYIPQAQMDQIIAHTPMSAPGETVEVEFTAPNVGDYPYICTYPGHYMTMQGTMHVVAE